MSFARSCSRPSARWPPPGPRDNGEDGGQDGASRLQGLLSADGPVTLERPRRAEFGDYSTNAALVLAPVLGSKPRELAESLGGVLPSGCRGSWSASRWPARGS